MHILNKRASHMEQLYDGFVMVGGWGGMETMHMLVQLQTYELHAIKVLRGNWI